MSRTGGGGGGGPVEHPVRIVTMSEADLERLVERVIQRTACMLALMRSEASDSEGPRKPSVRAEAGGGRWTVL